VTFASIEFATLLTLTLALYYALPQRGRMGLLLAASYAFYMYTHPIYALLILLASVIHYGAARAIEASASPGRRRAWMWTAVASSLAVLGYFKYTNFALDTLRHLGFDVGGPLSLALPIGISFYTFQVISYTVDVYRREIPAEKDFVSLALFIAFFPQLVAGPIERARELLPQLVRRQPFAWRNMEDGVRLLLWGLLKKTVFADRLTQGAMPLFIHPADYATGELAMAAVMMFVCIYLDFSAYADMATGSARLFGIRLTRNFDYPHTAANIAEFWRRWHITMSTWVRDYLFMPLGGFRPRNLRHHAQIMLVTMGLVGLWHGASWTFVLWGLGHGLALVIYHVVHMRVLRRYRRSRWLNSLPFSLGSWALMMTWYSVSSVLFFSPDISRALVFLRRMCVSPTADGFLEPYVLAGFAMILIFWIFHYIQSRRPLLAGWDRLPGLLRGVGYAALAFVIMIGAVGKVQSFIYFQF
jgi:alginate O-acetyltransferase complex protein AlgI